MANRILFAGGGTGGHVYPLVAVAEEVIKSANQAGIPAGLEFIGTGEILKNEAGSLGVKFKGVLSPKWRRYFSFANFIDLILFPFAFLQSFFTVWVFMPDVIFSKGGYAAFLPALAGRLMSIPLVIHETDAIPGSSNRFMSRLARKTFVAFDSAQQYFKTKKIETVGNPIRSGILNSLDKNVALSSFGLDPSKPVILITGASQGAQKINDILLLSLVELAKEFQIIHQTGYKISEEIKKQVDQLINEGRGSYGPLVAQNYRAYPIFNESQMAAAYSACDVIVSRSGSQIFETAAVAKPTVLIPLKHSAGNHQLANAREIAKFGAIVIEEDNLTPHLFINEIKTAYNNRTELSQKIKAFTRLDSARIIAGQLLSLSL